MEKDEIIGIYKLLSKDEELIFENKSLTPVVLVKEAFIKKVFNRKERKEMPISFSKAKTYLTTKRLIFLIMYQKYSRAFDNEESNATVSGVEGTWFEVPVSAIIDYETRPLVLKENMWKGNVEMIGDLLDTDRGNQSLLEIVYDEKQASGRSLEYVEAMMQRGRFSKLFGKVDSVSDKIFILGDDATTLAPSLKQFKSSKETSDDKEELFFCNKCGVKQTDSDSRFCGKCGAALQPPILEKS